jgi:hypothetical protein
MLDFTWKNERLLNKNGNWIYINSCPVTKLIRLSESLSYLATIQSKTSLSIQTLLDSDATYKLGITNLLQELLSWHGLKISDFDSKGLDALFIDPGHIYSINGFSRQKSDSNNDSNNNSADSISLFEFESKMVTQLIETGMAKNIREALDFADSFPHDKLRAYLNARFTQIDPELEKRERQKRDDTQLMQTFVNDFKTGKFFDSQSNAIRGVLDGRYSIHS